jgi:hypothetical protein
VPVPALGTDALTALIGLLGLLSVCLLRRKR